MAGDSWQQSESRTVASYRQLAEIYHDLLSRDSLEHLMDRLVSTVRELIPVSSILVAETIHDERVLVPLVAAGVWPEGFMEHRLPFGEGLIGLAAERGRPILANDAHRDSRAGHVAGTPEEDPESIISVPLVARGVVIGALSLYREGEDHDPFTDLEFELAQRFADAATLALENARTRAELRELSRRDELTGLLNRRGFNDLLAQALARSEPKGRSTGLLLVDLNKFKRVNDNHGHDCGDHLLIHVARLLESTVRGNDHVTRFGGDEFAIILPNITRSEAKLIATRISADLEATPMNYGNATIPIQASVGVAIAEDHTDPRQLLLEADRALYLSKTSTQTAPLQLVKQLPA